MFRAADSQISFIVVFEPADGRPTLVGDVLGGQVGQTVLARDLDFAVVLVPCSWLCCVFFFFGPFFFVVVVLVHVLGFVLGLRSSYVSCSVMIGTWLSSFSSFESDISVVASIYNYNHIFLLVRDVLIFCSHFCFCSRYFSCSVFLFLSLLTFLALSSCLFSLSFSLSFLSLFLFLVLVLCQPADGRPAHVGDVLRGQVGQAVFAHHSRLPRTLGESKQVLAHHRKGRQRTRRPQPCEY